MKISFEEIKNMNPTQRAELLQRARELSYKFFGKKLDLFYPNKFFPSVSITGAKCAQNCLYCNKHYLQQMISIESPKELEKFAYKLKKKGGKGMLISGGYDDESRLPFAPFLETIQQIKKNTNLKINLHPGLVSQDQAFELAETGIDSVSFDLITDNTVIKELINPKLNGDDYVRSFKALLEAKLNVIPHICIGLYYGKEKGNLSALKVAMMNNVKLIVFLGFIPTRGTEMEQSEIIQPQVMQSYLLYTRINNPKIEQSLGCMRVRLAEYEDAAIAAGINRIAVPKKKTIDLAKKEFNLELIKKTICCSL